jgi:hypothetical protein
MIANICTRDFAGIIDDDNQVCSSVLLCKFAYEILFMNGFNMSNKQHRHSDFHWFVVFEFANSISGKMSRNVYIEFVSSLCRIEIDGGGSEVESSVDWALEHWKFESCETRYLWNVVWENKKNSKRARGVISFTDCSQKSFRSVSYHKRSWKRFKDSEFDELFAKSSSGWTGIAVVTSKQLETGECW